MPSYFAVELSVDDQPVLHELFEAAKVLSVGSKPVGGVWYVRVDDDQDAAAPNRFVNALTAQGIAYSGISASEFWTSRSDPF
jgi:hypothetical protein